MVNQGSHPPGIGVCEWKRFLTCFFLFFFSNFISECVADVCYEYNGYGGVTSFHCSDGCCGSSSNGYCCLSPAIYIGIGIACIAFIIIVAAAVILLYQKKKKQDNDKIRKISVGREQTHIHVLRMGPPAGGTVSSGIGGGSAAGGGSHPFFRGGGNAAFPPSAGAGNPAFAPTAGNPAFPPSAGNPAFPPSAGNSFAPPTAGGNPAFPPAATNPGFPPPGAGDPVFTRVRGPLPSLPPIQANGRY